MNRCDTFGLSGADCAEALERLGLERVHAHDGATVLRRGRRVVVVPDACVLPGPILQDILACANVSLEDLLRALDDIPTEPELRSGVIGG
jgi:hypothetical protein